MAKGARPPRRRIRLTVRRAVMLAVLLGVLLPALLVGAYLARVFYSDKLESEVRNTLANNAELLSVGVSESLWSLDYESVGAMVEAAMKDPSLVRVEVRDPKLGRLVARERPERRVGQSFQTEQKVSRRGEEIGSVHIELTDAPLREALGQQTLTLASMLSLQMAGSVLLILFVLQRRVGDPLLRLGLEAERLSRGELERPIVPKHDDEIGDVEKRLEITRHALKELIGSLAQQNEALESDLAERRRVEAALRDREQRLRALVAQSPLAVIEFDLSWHVLDWNEAAERIFGWRREEIIGQHASRLVEAEGEDTLSAHLEASIARGRVRFHCLRAGAHEHIVCQWYNNLIRDASGNAQRIVALVEDITERQRNDEEIRRLAAVVRLTTNLVALTDRQGRVEWLNPAFGNRLGPGASAMLGQPLTQLIIQPDGEDSITAVSHALQAGRMLTLSELACRTQDGTDFWVTMELQPIRDEQGRILQWLALLTDISERRHMVEGLRSIARIGSENVPGRFFNHLLSALASATGASAAYLASHHEQGIHVEAS
ncbi:MAG: hypothetical protein CGU28_08995 [Candidatus Dactylopiibacterium carminicum]|uniref:PAS domain S-box protein n=1 Tax=Candidatus Dactylopiibacterium carminicum TaxID=857335 RepID=A0A272EWB2_9RHOO|nr:PAS domain S-box protein [Candidatus Dactylopiibacterium carminicum]KAF7599560.1 hypothetical protein BGI27_07260 [Candidatus Dactylopiibacterium carminicum]PAS94402.1 MAG: hypothetical protein CGU29_03565 [Candidatus Dactylopiibacterium carminicum]PAS96435.1 MAG: hypothetical protein CGU28_08995 [Candidatus Dactylopiibacterium carminicum]PAS99563.1 MAG: hypothetical protein BSR46_07295 [Candidatus Dactylopiibacterium carminicum]